jgi:hypothetical protein
MVQGKPEDRRGQESGKKTKIADATVSGDGVVQDLAAFIES